MAATKSTSKRSTSRNGSGAKSTSKSGARAKSSSSRKSTAPKQAASRSSSPNKGAGQTIAEAAGKVKTPLIAGGTALLGAAAGIAIKDRVGSKSKNPIKRMRGSSLPKVDLDTVKTAADRVSAYGQQASDIAAAVEKTRKKNG